MYYFAYGSNMSHHQMQERCPTSRFIGAVKLKDYCFVYDGYSPRRKGAVANIVPMPGSHVLGGLYEITQECLDNLDRYEEYPNTYNRMRIQVEDQDGQLYHDVITYYRPAKEPGIPSTDYRKIVISGAIDCGIPKSYIQRSLE